jgi:hypothetical protein
MKEMQEKWFDWLKVEDVVLQLQFIEYWKMKKICDFQYLW